MAETTKKETKEVKVDENAGKVPVRLQKDKRHMDDVFVGLNGVTYQIQRGVKVYVPEGVAEVLELSQAQDELALERMQELASKAR